MIARTTKEIGDLGERLAARYLRLHGYLIKERNYRAGKYEIDIIAASLRDLAFVEVKTRTCERDEVELLPPPKHAVHAQKQTFTRRAAQKYLYEHPTKKQPRMDVIEIWLSPAKDGQMPKLLKLNHIKAAY